MSAIKFSNVRLENDTEYFLYVGELKNYGLNHFLEEALTRIYNRKFKFIAIVPDIFEQYNYKNVIAINPLTDSYECQYGKKVSCRVSPADFLTAVSGSRQVHALIQQILRRQEHLFLYMYESLEEMTLDTIDRVSILGPAKSVAKRLNSKIYQARHLSSLIPMVDFKICEGLENLLETCDSLWDEWNHGIFITREYSAAGVNSIVAASREDILQKFKALDETYLITRFMPHDLDPTVLAVVANEEDVYIAGVADQCIEGGNRFTGSRFPSLLEQPQLQEIIEYTRTAGRWLAKEGYRGIFGCDYIVTEDKEVRFLEVNARKQGTTLEFCCTLEQNLPDGAPMLPELEFFAVTEGVFPVNAVEMIRNTKDLHWGTYNYKIKNSVITDSYIPQNSEERAAFEKVADGNLNKDFLILEHTGSDFVVAQGAFIGRIVALGHDHHGVSQGLRQGIRTIELTFVENHEAEKNHV